MQFVILFRDAGMQYRALYAYNPDDEVANELVVTKIHGTGPKQLSSKSMERFYKYFGFHFVLYSEVCCYMKFFFGSTDSSAVNSLLSYHIVRGSIYSSFMVVVVMLTIFLVEVFRSIVLMAVPYKISTI